jgi:hypothetical protein
MLVLLVDFSFGTSKESAFALIKINTTKTAAHEPKQQNHKLNTCMAAARYPHKTEPAAITMQRAE